MQKKGYSNTLIRNNELKRINTKKKKKLQGHS